MGPHCTAVCWKDFLAWNNKRIYSLAKDSEINGRSIIEEAIFSIRFNKINRRSNLLAKDLTKLMEEHNGRNNLLAKVWKRLMEGLDIMEEATR